MLHKLNLEFNEELKPRTTTQYIILHHSEVASSHTAEDIHQWHKNKGWVGIGYHYFVDKEGEVYEGRPRETVGAHTRGHNDESIGVCFEGDFNKESMSEKQENAAIKLLTILSLVYNDAELRTHNDFNPDKNCPGKNFPFNRLLLVVADRKKRIMEQKPLLELSSMPSEGLDFQKTCET